MHKHIRMLISGWILLSATLVSAQDQPANNGAPLFTVGINIHVKLGNNSPVDFDAVKQLGVNSMRWGLNWIYVEKTAGQWAIPAGWDEMVDQGIKLGIHPCLGLCYGNPRFDGGSFPTSPEAMEAYAQYCEFVVTHFKGRVHTYEVWNEWDYATGIPASAKVHKGDPAAYVALLAKVYPRIKAIDPSITVIGGSGFALASAQGPFLKGLLQAGILNYCQGLCIHPYVNGAPLLEKREPEYWADQLISVQEMIKTANGGKYFPLYVSEVGWSTYENKRFTSDELGAEYLARVYLLGRTVPELRGIWWYELRQGGWNPKEPEEFFGIAGHDDDLTPKAGYYALQTVGPLVANAQYVGRLDAKDPNVWILQFKEKSGRDVWAIWTAQADTMCQLSFQNNSQQRSSVVVQEVGRSEFTRGWYRILSRDDDQLNITVQAMPILLKGDLANVILLGCTNHPIPKALPDDPPKPTPTPLPSPLPLH